MYVSMVIFVLKYYVIISYSVWWKCLDHKVLITLTPTKSGCQEETVNT